MLTSIRTALRTCLLPLLTLAVPSFAQQDQTARYIQVLDVGGEAKGSAVTNATDAYNRGDIVRMIGASEADVIRLFGSRIGTFEVFQSSRQAVLGNVTPSSQPLHLQGIAGYKDAKGIVHTVQSFAPEEGPNSKAQTQWRQHLQKWVTREQAKAAQMMVGDPEPPAAAWTTLYTTTIQATSGYQNFQQDTIAVYRLVSTDPQTDYYLVYTTPEVDPNFTGSGGLPSRRSRRITAVRRRSLNLFGPFAAGRLWP